MNAAPKEILQNLYDAADSELSMAGHILDACIVLSALERAPEHHDTHPSHNIKTGNGFAHGNRLRNDTLPELLRHALYLIETATNEMGLLKEEAIEALEGSAT